MNKNAILLASFTGYCTAHPQERFWQALRNWCGYQFVAVSKNRVNWFDTFNWEHRDSQQDDA